MTNIGDDNIMVNRYIQVIMLTCVKYDNIYKTEYKIRNGKTVYGNKK